MLLTGQPRTAAVGDNDDPVFLDGDLVCNARQLCDYRQQYNADFQQDFPDFAVTHRR